MDRTGKRLEAEHGEIKGVKRNSLWLDDMSRRQQMAGEETWAKLCNTLSIVLEFELH